MTSSRTGTPAVRDDVIFTCPGKSLAAEHVRTTMSESVYDSDECKSAQDSTEPKNKLDKFMSEVQRTTDSLTELIKIAKALREKEHYNELYKRLEIMGRSDKYNENVTFQGMHKFFLFLARAGFHKVCDFDLGSKVLGNKCKLCALP